MEILDLHDWNVSPREAIDIQESLRASVIVSGAPRTIRYVAGADISWPRTSKRGYAGVIVFRFPSMEEVERINCEGPADFPYVPGLLTFREAPLLLRAFERLRHDPDLILIDGQGIAHPRRIGVASHMGLLLDRPTIGCAKSRLIGEHREPGPRRGNHATLRDGDDVIGAVLRTRDDVRPIYVSPGHRVGLEESVKLCLRCCDGYRVPRPTRLADHYVGALRREREARR